MGRMRIRHIAAAAVLAAAVIALTTCSNPIDLVEAATVEVMKANDRYLEVTGFFPALNSIDQNPGLAIQIVLDRAINIDDVLPENVVIQYTNSSSQVITATWTPFFDSATNVLSIRPEPYLEDSEEYSVSVSGLSGVDGSRMLSGVSWSFNTGIAPKGSIIVTSTDGSSQVGYTRTTTVTAEVDVSSAANEWFASASPILVVDGTLNWQALSYVFPLNMSSPVQGVNRIYAVFRNTTGPKYGVVTYKTITYDSIAPNAPSVPDLAADDDTGYSNSDNITKNTSSLTFTGTGEPNTTVRVRTSGTIYGTTTVSKFGTWSVDVSLAAGSYLLYSQATDRAGNIGSASSTVSVTVDTTAPTAPTTPDLLTADDSGMSSTDNITNISSGLTFTGTGSIASTRIYLNNGTTDLTYVTETDASWSIDLSLAQGSHSIRAINEDVAGNRSASGYLSILVDTTAPTVSIFTVNSGNPASTNNPNVTLYISATDNLGGSGLYQSHYGNYLQPWSPWENYDTTKSWTMEDIAGTRRVYIQITDYAGNITGQIYDEIVLNARLTVTFSSIYLTNDGDADVIITQNGEIYYYFYVDGVLRLSRSEASALSVASSATIAAQLPPTTFTIYESPTSGSYTITGVVYDDDSPASDDLGTLAAITYSAPFTDIALTYRTFGLVNSGEDVEGRFYYSVDFENP